MKKTVIAIRGASSLGKSSAIKEIVNRFIIYFPGAIINILIQASDIQAIIQVGHIKIGIESAGDPNSRLPVSVGLFLANGCDIIICASRTRGDTVEEIKALHSKHGFDIVWTLNYYSQQKPIIDSNRYFADHILFLVEQIMLGIY